MIKKFSLIATLLVLNLNLGAQRFELLSQTVKKEGDKIVASGDVLIYSKKEIFRANKAIYYPKSGRLELFGDVYLSQNSNEFLYLKHTIYNLKTSQFESKNIFAYDDNSNIWFDTKSVRTKGDIVKLKKSRISSCNRANPDWTIEFSKGFYNKKKEYISIYNPRFYFGNIPVLYLPWFGFPTNKERKSGFLKPILGFENSENIFLVTPYYIANEKNWDLELDPQVRVKRGFGLYSTLRFVDSNSSKGEFSLGYFRDNLSYQRRHNLKNRSHFGAKFKYQNRGLFTKNSNFLQKREYRDALWIDSIYLNDIDFINIDHTNPRASSKLATSRVNYFLENSIDYLGVYAKYFIDTEKSSNEDTLQTLPYIQYHRYSNTLHIPNILYSFDYKFKNNYRKEGLNAFQHEFSLPVTFYKSLFKEYINFQASENLYYSKVFYSNKRTNVEDATYFSNYHKFVLSSDLSKKYTSFIHNMEAQVSYTIPSKNSKSGYFAPFIPFSLEKKNISFKLNQYFYDMSGFNYLFHQFTQTLYKNGSKYSYDDFQNQIIYRPKKYISIQNTLFYSHKYDRIRKVQSDIFYNKDKYLLRFGQTYQYKKFDKNSNFITSYIENRVNSRYRIFASLDYDLEDSFTKEWSFGWKMQKRCWDYMFRYKESVTPNLTSSGAKSTRRRGVMFFVRFSPFGGMKYEYNKESELDNDNFAKLVVNRGIDEK